MADGNSTNTDLAYADTLWKSADALRGQVDAAEYKHVVLGLLFLKYISDAFNARREELKVELEAESITGPQMEALLENRDEYTAERVFWVPPEARWANLQNQATRPNIATLIDDAIVALPAQLFYTTGIPVCLWFLTRSKGGLGRGGSRTAPTNGRLALRERRGETLFIDARKLGTMQTRTLRVLTGGDTGETLNAEFKGEERSSLNDRDLVEAVICLANQTGAGPAWLLVGVEDNGRVTGARPRHGMETDLHKLAALIAEDGLRAPTRF